MIQQNYMFLVEDYEIIVTVVEATIISYQLGHNSKLTKPAKANRAKVLELALHLSQG
jgi:hypothetical protein